MTVYVDDIRVYPGAAKPFHAGSCHMTADTLKELHDMASRIGLKRAWFQDGKMPHYDLTPARRVTALIAGAVYKPMKQQLRERSS